MLTDTDVKEIMVRERPRHRRAFASGETIEARRLVVSAIDAPTTMRMAGEELFPEPTSDRSSTTGTGATTASSRCISRCASGRVYRSAAFDPDIDRAFNIFFGMDDIDQVAQCFEHCAAESFPDVLMGNGACNSHVDPTYAPADGHVAFWWPFAPYAVDGDAKNWDRRKDEYTQRVLNVWREFAGKPRRRQCARPLPVHAARYRAAER